MFVKLPNNNVQRMAMHKSCSFILFAYSFKNFFKKIQTLLYTLFKNCYNVIIIDAKYNYNYLPITNKEIFSHKSHKNLKKLLKYFSVGCIIFFDCGLKKKAVRNFLGMGLININYSGNAVENIYDLVENKKNTDITKYIIYRYILHVYLLGNM